MKIIDISREMLHAPVYPGDPSPRLEPLSRLELGDECNLSALYACLHSGTHLDTPWHFDPDGPAADQVMLEACIGECTVVEFDGLLLGAQAEKLVPGLKPRVLFKGSTELSPSAAFVLSDAGILLLGVEAPSVAPAECSAPVHRQLLGNGLVLLEGLDLSRVHSGQYFLFAPPLKIAGGDGSPVRAVLLERETIGWSEQTWKPPY